MELRKDPITRSWVVVGHREEVSGAAEGCPLCSLPADSGPILLRLPTDRSWQVLVRPHPDPLYRVEGDTGRRADGIYDAMRALGADEVVIETPEHDRELEDLPEDQIRAVLDAWALRIQDLKRDGRFKYVSVYKNRGTL